ncbi:XRE family transcriptional regulator [Salipiger aestuarii]|uniref:Cro/C1-type helix-turn-helix DNA-binding protein n=1 Tax=Salipiger aestuarii TaxID=568098 RepID=A0A327YNI3_9RHOB|nr:helix-turn-helix transcriptional regulator [Salipiger aestuarii]EIE48933.1 DNA-binding protein, putative [Citreicella sp. 357]KAA8610319.1 XRE family transcriptional regulator [Salipiger aestuarii]KAA8616334.1 XRE family transcriptional regulator [Salipiger aestuarii]KAB2543571.1 XRE family transcriptional regulator [Salipiger aestuarii]RAK21856.1 Cro/C1-type helix-turn-helix DNA-binding protein [Salipiger aestuarii]
MATLPRDRDAQPSPAELRGVFGANLRQLGDQAPSISALCRDLGINRTQFNRYLAGESFPRPDVLHRICQFFDVDARILLEPVGDMAAEPSGMFNHPFIAEFVGAQMTGLTEDHFPSGFYRFSRAAFSDTDRFVVGLVHVSREQGYTFLRGFEPKEALSMHNMPTDPRTREFRGLLMPQAEGVAAMVSRRDAVTSTFNYLARTPAIAKIFWLGYTVRTMPEDPIGRRVARLVYEYLGTNTAQILSTARKAGYATEQDLEPFHRKQLRIAQPFF